jgi:hypothetical protein
MTIQEGHLTPITELRPDLPPSMDEWFQTALARDIGNRFQSAAQMSVFEETAAGSGAPQEPILLVRRASSLLPRDAARSARIPLRRRIPLYIVAVVAGVAFGVAIGVLGRSAQARYPSVRLAGERVEAAEVVAVHKASVLRDRAVAAYGARAKAP